MEVPVRGLAAILYSRLLGSQRQSIMGAFFRHHFFFIILFLSFYRFNLWSICSKLQTRPHLRKFTFIYILLLDFFLPECFVTIATGIAQNPGLKALRRIPAWTFVRQFSDCGCLDSYTNNFSSAHTSPVISLSGLSGQRVIT